MYCVKCGVELQEGLRKCPLCGLRVYHPFIEEDKDFQTYPEYREQQTRYSFAAAVILTFLLIIPIVVCVITNLMISGRLSWSMYVLMGIIIFYAFAVLPLWFKKRNPVIFFPSAASTVVIALYYICVKTSGEWFFSFALPVCSASIVIIEAVITLLYYVAQKKAHRIAIILGSGIIGVGSFCVLLEFLIHVCFARKMIWWSLFPFSVTVVVGIMVIIIGSVKNLREAIQKKIFI